MTSWIAIFSGRSVSQGSVASIQMVMATALIIGCGVASTTLWWFSQRYVGEMSLLVPDKLCFSVLDFWGNRQVVLQALLHSTTFNMFKCTDMLVLHCCCCMQVIFRSTESGGCCALAAARHKREKLQLLFDYLRLFASSTLLSDFDIQNRFLRGC